MEPSRPLPSAAVPVLRRTARDVRMHLLGRLSLIHAAGAFMVFSYLQQLYPASSAFDTPWLNDLVLLVGTEVILAPIAWLWFLKKFGTSGRWALDGRTPTVAERERILDEPWRMAARPFLLWAGSATVICTVVAVRSEYAARQVLEIGQIMLIGGLGVCAISYLVVEQTYRPLFAFALAGEAPPRPASLGIRPRLMLAWAVSSGVPLLGLATAPLRDSGRSLAAISVLALLGIVGGIFSVLVASNSIAEPLDEVRRALGRVAGGDLQSDLSVDDGGEVGQVQAGFNRMVAGLRERAELHDLFSKHVGHEVAAQALEHGTGLGGESRRASVVFVDLIGSTAMSEVLPPGEVVSTLNAFFQGVVDTVQAEGGWVNKFEGDGALCVFGAPGFQPDHEARALRAARALHDRMQQLADEHPGLDAGIGVSSGTVVAGNVGTEERYEYTVIGRAVNEASRLTDLAKQRPGRVLASSNAVRAAGPEQAEWVDRGSVGLRGQQAPTLVFEPTAVGTSSRSPTHPARAN
ncbi:MAG: adenylate/guanylate cyclase domain-containing protein [Acidimicrobiales bacterium]|nr:adenylate/guanylate cyclase domain-containing protein [Acidimicrobiales bacterium]